MTNKRSKKTEYKHIEIPYDTLNIWYNESHSIGDFMEILDEYTSRKLKESKRKGNLWDCYVYDLDFLFKSIGVSPQ